MQGFHYRTAAAAAVIAVTATGASAAHLTYYESVFLMLNNSGVSGSAFLTFDDGTENAGMSTLNVRVSASGLEPGPHPAHIHGFDDGTIAQSPVPPLFDPDVDGNADGFTSLADGLPFYGPILLTLEGLTADGLGNVDYAMTFAIDPDGPLFDPVIPLSNQHLVLHGLTTDFALVDEAGLEGLGGGIDTSVFSPNTFNALLPIAVGELRSAATPIPLPAAGWMLLAAIGGLGALRARKPGARA